MASVAVDVIAPVSIFPVLRRDARRVALAVAGLVKGHGGPALLDPGGARAGPPLRYRQVARPGLTSLKWFDRVQSVSARISVRMNLNSIARRSHYRALKAQHLHCMASLQFLFI